MRLNDTLLFPYPRNFEPPQPQPTEMLESFAAEKRQQQEKQKEEQANMRLHTWEIGDGVGGDLSFEHIASKDCCTCWKLFASIDHEVVAQYERAVCDIIVLAENVP
jgi:hypothetical protein